MGLSPHCSQAKDSFTPGVSAWCYQHDGYILPGLLCLCPGPCLGEGDQLCWHDCSHGELHYHWTEVKQTPLGFCGCFAQTDICMQQWKLAQGSLYWKKKDQLANKRQYPNAWGRCWLWCLHVFPSHLGGLLMKVPRWRLSHWGWFDFKPTAQLKWHNGNWKVAWW